MDPNHTMDALIRSLPILVGFRVKQSMHPPLDVQFARKRLASAEKAYGPESVEIVPFLLDVAYHLVRNGPDQFKEALPHLWKACNLLKKSDHSHDLQMASALTKLGQSLIFTGDTVRAEPLLKQAAAIRETELGIEHPLTGQTMAQLAMMEIIKANPGLHPLAIRSSLYQNPIQIAGLPVPAQDAARKALRSYNKYQSEVFDGSTSTPSQVFNYRAIMDTINLYERSNTNFNERMEALKNMRGGNSGSCFIASAVYGDVNCHEVKLLREFRNRKLLPRIPGRILVRCYEIVGPILAGWLKGHSRFIRYCRRCLDAIVHWIESSQISQV